MDSLSRKRDSAESPSTCGERASTKQAWSTWPYAVLGLASLVWFLARVLPKPSRAMYPCQRAAAPLASGFVIWVAGLAGARVLYRRTTGPFQIRSFAAVAVALASVMVLAAWLAPGLTPGSTIEATAQEIFVPTDQPNKPIGVGKGIHPGRVAWVHNPDATSWDGATGDWWDDTATDQSVVDDMVSATLQSLTGRQKDEQAWEALFKHFNQTRNLGDIGYEPGEKVTVKINSNQDRSEEWTTGEGMASPHVLRALLDQLINVAGVPGEDITIYDASRLIGDPIYDKLRAGSDPSFKAVNFVVRPRSAGNGRVGANFDKANPVHFALSELPTAYLPQCVTEAKYLINIALFRAHISFGVTLTAKNHFGSVHFPENGGWSPRTLHESGNRKNPMGSYNNLVDLIGHEHLGGKTLLYMLDGLYGAEHNEGTVIHYLSFGDDWTSSIFASQDPLAIDSVALDFLRNEPRATQVTGNPAYYMHEAALADKPPSGTV